MLRKLQKREISEKNSKKSISSYNKVFYKIDNIDNPNYQYILINNIYDEPTTIRNIPKSYVLFLNIKINKLITKYNYKNIDYIIKDSKKTLIDIFRSLKVIYPSINLSTDTDILDYLYISKNTLYIIDDQSNIDTKIEKNKINNFKQIFNNLPLININNKIILKNKNNVSDTINNRFNIVINDNNILFTLNEDNVGLNHGITKINTIIIDDLNKITSTFINSNQTIDFYDKNVEDFYYLQCRSPDNTYNIIQLIYIRPEIIEKYNFYFYSYNLPINFEIIKTGSGYKQTKSIIDKLKIREKTSKKTIIKGVTIPVYKVYYLFKGNENPNNGYKIIFNNFLKFNFNNIKYYDEKCNITNINLSNDTFENTLENLYHIRINENIICRDKINNFYISEDNKTLFIIEDKCLYYFDIKNKYILSILDKLPSITGGTDIFLTNFSLIENFGMLNVNDNVYKCIYDIQIFIFNNNKQILIDTKQSNTDFSLEGNIQNWYFIFTLANKKNIIQLIYITPNIIREYNHLFSINGLSIKFIVENNEITIGGNKKIRKLLKIY